MVKDHEKILSGKMTFLGTLESKHVAKLRKSPKNSPFLLIKCIIMSAKPKLAANMLLSLVCNCMQIIISFPILPKIRLMAPL